MNPLPLVLGAGALAAIAVLFSSKPASAAEQKIAVVIPSRKKVGGGGGPVVSFTKRKVFWRTNKRTGKEETRTQVIESPETLAAMASEKLGRKIPIGIFSLATMIASEAGSQDLAKVAVAHAALTYTKKHGGGKTLHQLLVGKDGHYGGQQGRYASTKNAPALRDIEVAEAVAAGKILNPAPGAIQWDSPKAQDSLYAEGEAGYSSDADGLARKREAEGKVAVFLPGVDRGYLRLWKTAA